MNKKLLLLAIIISGAFVTKAQTAEQYWGKVSSEYQEVAIAVWGYTKAAKNSGDMMTMENKRTSVLSKVEKATKALEVIGGWENDLRYYSAVKAYYDAAATALNTKYPELIHLEKSKKGSYQNMLKFQKGEKAIRDELIKYNIKAVTAQDNFSKEYKMDINSDHTGMYKRMQKSAEVYDYYDVIYMLTFNCKHFEQELMKAIEENDIAKIEAARKGLLKSANDGLAKMKTIKAFENKDDRLRKPTNSLLTFYKDEAENHVPSQIDYFESKKHFEDHVKKMKGMKKRTKADVDNFNKEMREMKKKTELYNRENKQVNGKRSYVVNVWNNDAENFVDLNTPQ